MTPAAYRVLLVEDDYFIADELRRAFAERGAEVLGPAARVADALALVPEAVRIDGAVLDINLRDGTVFPLADALRARGVPFVFTTGYERGVVPARFADVVHCQKLVEIGRVIEALLG